MDITDLLIKTWFFLTKRHLLVWISDTEVISFKSCFETDAKCKSFSVQKLFAFCVFYRQIHIFAQCHIARLTVINKSWHSIFIGTTALIMVHETRGEFACINGNFNESLVLNTNIVTEALLQLCACACLRACVHARVREPILFSNQWIRFVILLIFWSPIPKIGIWQFLEKYYYVMEVVLILCFFAHFF